MIHCQNSWDHPTRWVHCPVQKLHSVVLNEQRHSPAVYTPRWHPSCPSHRHTLSPTVPGGRSLLCQSSGCQSWPASLVNQLTENRQHSVVDMRHRWKMDFMKMMISLKLYLQQWDFIVFSCTNMFLPSQTTPASSLWLQLWAPNPRWLHSVSFDSVPVHVTSSNQMGPLPCPKRAFPGADRTLPQPSCLHTTWASTRPQASSHTVPHCPRWKISTLPEQELFLPSARRTCPSTPVLLPAGVVVLMLTGLAAEVSGVGWGVVGKTAGDVLFTSVYNEKQWGTVQYNVSFTHLKQFKSWIRCEKFNLLVQWKI